MKIGGMGGLELVIILVVILIIFGPKNLPKLGNAIGKTLSNLRSGMNEGKKKEVDEAAANEEPAPAAASEEPTPARIEGDVEDVVFDEDEPDVNQDAAAASDEVIEGAAAAVSDAEAAVDEAFQPKKVKRVVKRKVD